MDAACGDVNSAYRRQARRLRATLRHRPLELHASLRNLARYHDAARRKIPQAAPTPANRFANEVTKQLGDGVLPYDTRLAMLRRADHLRIERFEANLIIAALQNRMSISQLPIASRIRRQRLRGIAPFVVFALVQASTLLAAWLLLIR